MPTTVKITHVVSEIVEPLRVDYVALAKLRNEEAEIRQNWSFALQEHQNECDFCQDGEMCESLKKYRDECIRALRLNIRRQNVALCNQALFSITWGFCKTCMRSARSQYPDCMVDCVAKRQRGAAITAEIELNKAKTFDGELLFPPVKENQIM